MAGLFLNMNQSSGGQDNEFLLEAWNGNPYIGVVARRVLYRQFARMVTAGIRRQRLELAV